MENRFLWVEFQLQAVCEQVSDFDIEKTLENIPMDIGATYERILDIINNKPPGQRELAKRALIFIAYARYPISIDVLALAIAAKDHTQTLDMLRSSLSAEKTILHACGNLLSIDNTDPKIRRACFVHFSVHEFLISHLSKLVHTLSCDFEAAAHREVARMCMSFLLILYSHIRDRCTPTERSFANGYILCALPHHLLIGNLNSLPFNDEIVKLTLLYFERSPPLFVPSLEVGANQVLFCFSPSVLALVFNLPGTYQRYDPKVLCGNQLADMVLTLVHDKYLVQVSDNRLALHYAVVMLDSIAVCERLYRHGYPIEYSHHRFDRPLKIFKPVVLGNITPRICSIRPIYLAQSEEVARFLLSEGASVNSTVANDGSDPLEDITRCGNTRLIHLLLDHSAKHKKKAQRNALGRLALLRRHASN